MTHSVIPRVFSHNGVVGDREVCSPFKFDFGSGLEDFYLHVGLEGAPDRA